MRDYPEPIDLRKVRVYPLAQRQSLSSVDRLLVDPATEPRFPTALRPVLERCAKDVSRARRQEASVLLMYGAHLIKNGGQRIVNDLVAAGWITHLATNGAGAIHDWELA